MGAEEALENINWGRSGIPWVKSEWDIQSRSFISKIVVIDNKAEYK